MSNLCEMDGQVDEIVDGRERGKEERVQSSSFISIFFIRTFKINHSSIEIIHIISYFNQIPQILILYPVFYRLNVCLPLKFIC